MKFKEKPKLDKIASGIYSLTLDKGEDYVSFLMSEQTTLEKYIFRGQGNSSWKLKPSVLRDMVMEVTKRDGSDPL